MKTILLSLLLASVTLAGEPTLEVPTTAVNEPRSFNLWEATQAYAVLSYSSETDEAGAGIRLAYNINDHVKIRADYVSAFDDFANGSEFAASSQASLAFLYPVDAVPGLALYTITGVGVDNFDDLNMQVIAGAGIEYAFRETWQVFLEYQYGSEQRDSAVMLGFGVTF